MVSPTTAGEQKRPPFIVAIGASGGEGLTDIRDLLAALPVGLPAVVLVVLHRPSDQVSHLKEVLSRASQMPVLIPQQGDQFRAGYCYVGEPDAHLTLAQKSNVRLVEGAGDKHRNRTIDILFNSVAAHAGARGIGIVLSGSLSDGSKGWRQLHTPEEQAWCSPRRDSLNAECRRTQLRVTAQLMCWIRPRRLLVKASCASEVSPINGAPYVQRKMAHQAQATSKSIRYASIRSSVSACRAAPLYT